MGVLVFPKYNKERDKYAHYIMIGIAEGTTGEQLKLTYNPELVDRVLLLVDLHVNHDCLRSIQSQKTGFTKSTCDSLVRKYDRIREG